MKSTFEEVESYAVRVTHAHTGIHTIQLIDYRAITYPDDHTEVSHQLLILATDCVQALETWICNERRVTVMVDCC